MMGTNRGIGGAVVEIFEYVACGGAETGLQWNGWAEADDAAVAVGGEESHGEHGGRQREEDAQSFEKGREHGRAEGRAMEREAQMAARSGLEEGYKRQLGKLAADFGVERDRFLQAVEREVVKLALAVAARILRREAQMDPLLLTGAVRVALGQLAGTTEVFLKVPAAQMEMWREAIGLIPNSAVKPEVVAGEGMRIGDCVIESRVGKVDLGVRSQLAEIERGFFDRTGGERMNEESAGSRSQGEV